MQLADCKTVKDYREWCKERGWELVIRDMGVWYARIFDPVSSNVLFGQFAGACDSNRLTAVRMACAAADAREPKP